MGVLSGSGKHAFIYKVHSGALNATQDAPKPVKRLLANGSWVVSGLWCPTGNNTFVIRKDSSSGQWDGYWQQNTNQTYNYSCTVDDVRSHAACIAPIGTQTVPDIANLLVTMLALIALAVFSHDELRRAAALCHVAAAAAGILPSFYCINTTRHLHRPHLHWLLCLLMLAVPLVQLCVAMMVLLASGVLSITADNQASNIQVVVNSVALAFVLELDNRIGAMIHSQHTQWHADAAAAAETAAGCTFARNLSPLSLKSPVSSFLGHVYFAAVGLLLTIEPAVLSPFGETLLLQGVRTDIVFTLREAVYQTDATNIATRSTWWQYISLGFFMPVSWLPGPEQIRISPAEIFGVKHMYLSFVHTFTVVGLVLLLFYRPLPPPTLSIGHKSC